MRGYGTIFGTEQSGAKDVGLDLQAALLRSAVESLKQELIIAVPECSIRLELPIEKHFENDIGLMPNTSDLSAIARWEGLLVERIIQSFHAVIRNTLLQGIKNNSSTTTPLSPHIGRVHVETILREYLSASTSNKLIGLLAKWESIFPTVSSIEQIFCIDIY